MYKCIINIICIIYQISYVLTNIIKKKKNSFFFRWTPHKLTTPLLKPPTYLYCTHFPNKCNFMYIFWTKLWEKGMFLYRTFIMKFEINHIVYNEHSSIQDQDILVTALTYIPLAEPLYWLDRSVEPTPCVLI